MLRFYNGLEGFILWHNEISPLALAVFDVCGLLTEAGSGNQPSIVPFQRTNAEQLGDTLIFSNDLKLLLCGTTTSVR